MYRLNAIWYPGTEKDGSPNKVWISINSNVPGLVS